MKTLRKFNITLSNSDNVYIREVLGEILIINNISIGLRKISFGEPNFVFMTKEETVWQATHLETGMIIGSDSLTRKQIIQETTKKIKSDKWDRAIAKAKEQLKRLNVKVPVNDI